MSEATEKKTHRYIVCIECGLMYATIDATITRGTCGYCIALHLEDGN